MTVETRVRHLSSSAAVKVDQLVDTVARFSFHVVFVAEPIDPGTQNEHDHVEHVAKSALQVCYRARKAPPAT